MKHPSLQLKLITLTCGLLIHGQSWAFLGEAYTNALDSDPDFQSALAQSEIAAESYYQARAALLPQATLQGQKGTSDTTTTIPSSNRTTSNKYDSYNYTLQIKQALLRPSSFFGFLQGKAQAKSAETKLIASSQELAIKVTQVFCDLTTNKAAVKADKAGVQAALKDYTAKKSLFKAGDASLIDVTLSESNYKKSISQLKNSERQLREAKNIWKKMTRFPEPNISFAPNMINRLPLPSAPIENDSDAMSSFADAFFEELLAINPLIQSYEYQLEAANKQVSKTYSDHLPTLDIIGSNSRSQSASEISIGNKYQTSSVMLQFTVPIFSGGYTLSTNRQAIAGVKKAQAELDAIRTNLRIDIEKNLQELNSAKSERDAALASIHKAQLSVRAAELGQKSRIATEADYANAQAELFRAELDLIKANSKALYSFINLEGMKNRLTHEVLNEVAKAISN